MQARKAAAAIYIVCFLHTFISVPINPQVAYNTNTKHTNILTQIQHGVVNSWSSVGENTYFVPMRFWITVPNKFIPIYG